jgi:hypothetical protein
MRKATFILLITVILSGCTQLKRGVFVPSEIEQYCRKVQGNSYDSGAMSTCIRNEYSAKDELSRMIIPPDIKKKCRQLSDSTGGSYLVLLTCVQQEMQLKKRGK